MKWPIRAAGRTKLFSLDCFVFRTSISRPSLTLFLSHFFSSHPFCSLVVYFWSWLFVHFLLIWFHRRWSLREASKLFAVGFDFLRLFSNICWSFVTRVHFFSASYIIRLGSVQISLLFQCPWLFLLSRVVSCRMGLVSVENSKFPIVLPRNFRSSSLILHLRFFENSPPLFNYSCSPHSQSNRSSVARINS
jgi:hypothetical protein